MFNKILASLLLIGGGVLSLPAAEILDVELVGYYGYIEKILYHGHSYIHFVNSAYGTTTTFVHDPDCECFTLGKK